MTQQVHSWVYISGKKSKSTNPKLYKHPNVHRGIIIAKVWKQRKCPSQIKYMCIHMHAMEYYSVIKKMTFCICSNMDRLGGHYTVRQILLWYHLYVESEKIQHTSEWKKQKKRKQTHTENKSVVGHQWGEAKEVIMEVYEIVCVKHLKIVKHYKI